MKLILILAMLFMVTPVYADWSSGTTVQIHDKVQTSIVFPTAATTNTLDASNFSHVILEATAKAVFVLHLGYWSNNANAYATQATISIATAGYTFDVFPTYGVTNMFVQVTTDEGTAAHSVDVWLTPIDELFEQEYKALHWFDSHQ